jgi:hypothetical protein
MPQRFRRTIPITATRRTISVNGIAAMLPARSSNLENSVAFGAITIVASPNSEVAAATRTVRRICSVRSRP